MTTRIERSMTRGEFNLMGRGTGQPFEDRTYSDRVFLPSWNALGCGLCAAGTVHTWLDHDRRVFDSRAADIMRREGRS